MDKNKIDIDKKLLHDALYLLVKYLREKDLWKDIPMEIKILVTVAFPDDEIFGEDK